jgi:NAD(P)-dependent dehydrogenase (short-subunit alcohol dehydrogenase family)
MEKPLARTVALVAGATRGTGRGIATMLGEAGATVYCTGRSTRAEAGSRGRGRGAPFDLAHRPETIEETAELVTARGGRGIAVRVDHTDEAQVQALVARVREEQGRLDVLVNDVWGGDALAQWGKPPWELSLPPGFEMVERVLRTHVVTSRHALPLLLDRGAGLVVEVTDGDTLGYRLELFYDLAKLVPIRLAYALDAELEAAGARGITSLAVTPGFLRSEAMLELFGVAEANWRDAVAAVPHFSESETPCYVGRGVAALAADPEVGRFAGQVLSSWRLAREYGFRDLDGRQPDWGSFFEREVARIAAAGPRSEPERLLLRAWFHQTRLDPGRERERERVAALLGFSPPRRGNGRPA